MQYWDKNGNIFDDSLPDAGIVQQAYNKAIAGLTNAKNWLNEENSNSDAYKQKQNLLLSLGLTALGTAQPYNGIKPYLKEILAGRELFLKKPYDLMSKEEKNAYADKGEKYYKEYLNGNPVASLVGEVVFNNNRARETHPRNMWQYPFVRFNLSRAKNNTPTPNYKPDVRNNTEMFNNLDVNMFGKKYIYQLRKNKNYNNNDFYNITEKDAFLNNVEKLKQDAELWQKFIDMQKK